MTKLDSCSSDGSRYTEDKKYKPKKLKIFKSKNLGKNRVQVIRPTPAYLKPNLCEERKLGK